MIMEQLFFKKKVYLQERRKIAAEGVKSFVAKSSPERVTGADPDVGPFESCESDTTGASNVNTVCNVARSCPIVTSSRRLMPAPLGPVP
jgi:hypothetical protein